jgi:hypothetical protein
MHMDDDLYRSLRRRTLATQQQEMTRERDASTTIASLEVERIISTLINGFGWSFSAPALAHAGIIQAIRETQAAAIGAVATILRSRRLAHYDYAFDRGYQLGLRHHQIGEDGS